MSSIDEEAMRRFFHQRLVPAAVSIRARDVPLLQLALDPNRSSWWETPACDEPQFMEVEFECMEELLRRHWAEKGLPELAELAAPLMELAKSLEQTHDQSADVSPFTYVMY